MMVEEPEVIVCKENELPVVVKEDATEVDDLEGLEEDTAESTTQNGRMRLFFIAVTTTPAVKPTIMTVAIMITIIQAILCRSTHILDQHVPYFFVLQ